MALAMTMKDASGVEMWRIWAQHFEPDLGSRTVSGLRGILGHKFRRGERQGYVEDLDIFDLKINSWEKTPASFSVTV